MIYADIYAKLAADPTITGAVSTYLGAPAIITAPIALTDVECPFVLIEQASAGPGIASPRCLRSWTETLYVRVVDDRDQSAGTINTIAHAVHLALDRTNISETYGAGYGRGYLECTGAQYYLDADGFPGAIVTVTANLWI